MRLVLFVLLSLPAAAAPKVVTVLPPQKAALGGPSVDLEARLGHSEDVTLISRGAQLEILRGLKLKPDAKVDDKLALKLGRLSGSDGVVTGTAGAWRLCRLPEGTCAVLDAADAQAAANLVFKELGAKPPPKDAGPFSDETTSAAALTAYASCRAAVSLGIEQAAIKGRKTALKGLDGDCKKALQADPQFQPAKAALAAAQALQADNTADVDLRAAMEELPTDPLPPAALFYLLVAAEQHQEALDALAAAEARAPQLLDLRRLRGERLFGMDMFKEAQPEFEKALELAPRSPYLHWRLSYTLHMGGNDLEAVKHAEQASQLSGGDHPFYQEEYASRLIDVERYAEAQKILEPLRKADKGWGRVALRLGWALHKQGRSKEALPLFAEAAKAKPRDPREKDDKALAEVDVARAHAKLGNADAAFKQLSALKAAGTLSAFDLKDADFDALRDDPRFVALGP